MSYILSIADASGAQNVGGKASGLNRLVGWDFDVPEAVVVTAEACRDATAGAALPSLVGGAASENSLAETRAAIGAAPLPAGLQAELEELWGNLQARTTGPLALACRSSATGEDSSAASFAGQYATVLGITTFTGLLDAVRACWSSLWTAEAVAYRRRTGGPAPLMAIVVQRMVRAEVSGVAFSVNPVTADEGQVVINSSFGLGELVVSGTITPDTFVVDKATRQLVTSELSAEKTRMMVLLEDGTIEEQAVDLARAASPSLNAGQIAEVAGAAIRAEKCAGLPQDIEWAFESDRLLLLQSRPVTTR